MTSQVNDQTEELHVVTENGEQCFTWRANTLTYIAQDRQEVPLVLANKFGALATKLDLSYNNLTSFRNINLFTNLNELILDNNCLEDCQLEFRQNLRLKTLSLNKNRLNDLSELAANIKVCFPNLEFLSLIGNPLCPTPIATSGTQFNSRMAATTSVRGVKVPANNTSSSSDNLHESIGFYNAQEFYEQHGDFAYQKYRYFIIYHLPNLRFLDSSPISDRERDAALNCCHWMMGNKGQVSLNGDGGSVDRMRDQPTGNGYDLLNEGCQTTSFLLQTPVSAQTNGIHLQGCQNTTMVSNEVHLKGILEGTVRAIVSFGTTIYEVARAPGSYLLDRSFIGFTEDKHHNQSVVAMEERKRHLVNASIVACVLLICACLIVQTATTDNATSKRTKNLAAAANSSCNRTVLDTCVTTLMVYGRRDVYLPQNQAEMVPHCQEEFDAEDCIKNFARKCLAPFERQVTGMLILGAGQVLRKRCGADGTKEYLSHYQCIKKTIPNLHDAMDQLIYTLMLVSEDKNTDVKIPTSCCSFARFQDYAYKIVKSSCSQIDKTAEEYIGTKMVKGYMNDVLDLSCQGYELGSPKCGKIKLPDGFFEWKNNTLIKMKTAKLPANKPNSVIWPFLDIFTNL